MVDFVKRIARHSIRKRPRKTMPTLPRQGKISVGKFLTSGTAVDDSAVVVIQRALFIGAKKIEGSII